MSDAASIRAEEDRTRGDFLRGLDESEWAVDDWEANFLASFLDFISNRPSDEPRWWTDGRRGVVTRLAQKYPDVARRAGLKAAPQAVAAKLDLPTMPGKCGYFTRDDERRQRRCGAPAVVKLRAGLELCAEHEQQRQEGIERLRKFKERQLRS